MMIKETTKITPICGVFRFWGVLEVIVVVIRNKNYQCKETFIMPKNIGR